MAKFVPFAVSPYSKPKWTESGKGGSARDGKPTCDREVFEPTNSGQKGTKAQEFKENQDAEITKEETERNGDFSGAQIAPITKQVAKQPGLDRLNHVTGM